LIAFYEGVEFENVVVGSGSTELIYCFFQSLQKEKVIIPVPTYSEYEAAAVRYGFKPIFVGPCPNYGLDLNGIETQLGKGPGAIIVCNPNNPTGRFFDKQAMLELAQLAKDTNSILFVDQAYLCFVRNQIKYSMAEFINKYPVFVLNSLSKQFGMPSLRLGWGLAARDLAEKVNEKKIPGTLSNLSIWAGEILLEDLDFQKEMMRFLDRERTQLFINLSKIKGIRVHPTETNFILLELTSSSTNSSKVFERLAQDGIVVRDCSRMRGLGDRFIRVTVRTKSDNAKLVLALKKALQTAKNSDAGAEN